MIPFILRLSVAVFFLFSFTQFGCVPVGGESDVPCLEPTAWTKEFFVILARQDGDDVLLTAQTSDQRSDDFNDDDGVIGNGEHGPVYRFDTDTEEFTLVDESLWDASQGEISDCRRNDGTLRFGSFVVDGQEVPVRGRAVLTSGLGNVAAILSTNGVVAIPLITGASTGQHYSQFFSTEDFSPLSDPVQVGVGDSIIQSCWTPDGRFLFYHQRAFVTQSETAIEVLCFVENTTEVIIETEEESP